MAVTPHLDVAGFLANKERSGYVRDLREERVGWGLGDLTRHRNAGLRSEGCAMLLGDAGRWRKRGVVGARRAWRSLPTWTWLAFWLTKSVPGDVRDLREERVGWGLGDLTRHRNAGLQAGSFGAPGPGGTLSGRECTEETRGSGGHSL